MSWSQFAPTPLQIYKVFLNFASILKIFFAKRIAITLECGSNGECYDNLLCLLDDQHETTTGLCGNLLRYLIALGN
jgi:hypothetical protein